MVQTYMKLQGISNRSEALRQLVIIGLVGVGVVQPHQVFADNLIEHLRPNFKGSQPVVSPHGKFMGWVSEL